MNPFGIVTEHGVVIHKVHTQESYTQLTKEKKKKIQKAHTHTHPLHTHTRAHTGFHNFSYFVLGTSIILLRHT